MLPVTVLKTSLCRFSSLLLLRAAGHQELSRFRSITPDFKKMHMNNLSTSRLDITNSYLGPFNTTGSTPEHFIPPPDKPEYHPYRLAESSEGSPETGGKDWQDELELDTVTMLAQQQPTPLRFLVLYGSLRQTSYSRLLAFEMARLLEVRFILVSNSIVFSADFALIPCDPLCHL